MYPHKIKSTFSADNSKQYGETIRFCIFAAVIFICFSGNVLVQAEPQSLRRVLVLHSYNPMRRWTKVVMDGIESTLDEYDTTLLLDVEYMHTQYFNDQKHYENLYNLYKNKADNKRYNAIIVCDDNALTFLLKHRTQLYPNVPVVFCGINSFRDSMLTGHNSITGITEEATLESTVETALKLHPMAQQVVILWDKKILAERHEILSRRCERLSKSLYRPVAIECSCPAQADKKHLIEAISGLGSESIVVFAGKFTETGKLDIFKNISSEIHQHCEAPIYVLSEQWFDYAPVIGGMFNSAFHQGEVAAQMAIRILNDESAENIPVLRGESTKYIFDYVQLKRFKIPFLKLPEGSIIINEPTSFYHLYKKGIFTVIAVAGSLVVISIILFFNILHRKRVGKKLLIHQAKLKSLSSKLSLAEERQRRRIATELHDNISQSLVIAKLKLESLRQRKLSDNYTDTFDEVCDSLDETIQNTKSLTFELCSPILYEIGFEEAVAEWIEEHITKKCGILATFEDDGRPKPLSDDVCALLFRDVKELLNNVVRHAQASKIAVRSCRVNSQIQISIEDDGVGFDTSKVTSKSTRIEGFGLFIIRERLEQLGGSLEILSQPGQGTKVIISAPLEQNN